MLLQRTNHAVAISYLLGTWSFRQRPSQNSEVSAAGPSQWRGNTPPYVCHSHRVDKEEFTCGVLLMPMGGHLFTVFRFQWAGRAQRLRSTWRHLDRRHSMTGTHSISQDLRRLTDWQPPDLTINNMRGFQFDPFGFRFQSMTHADCLISTSTSVQFQMIGQIERIRKYFRGFFILIM